VLFLKTRFLAGRFFKKTFYGTAPGWGELSAESSPHPVRFRKIIRIEIGPGAPHAARGFIPGSPYLFNAELKKQYFETLNMYEW
jgi:hypothetical protein